MLRFKAKTHLLKPRRCKAGLQITDIVMEPSSVLRKVREIIRHWRSKARDRGAADEQPRLLHITTDIEMVVRLDMDTAHFAQPCALFGLCMRSTQGSITLTP